MNTVIFDVGNVLAGYDWKSYLRTFQYPEEIYEMLFLTTRTGLRATSDAFPWRNGLSYLLRMRRI